MLKSQLFASAVFSFASAAQAESPTLKLSCRSQKAQVSINGKLTATPLDKAIDSLQSAVEGDLSVKAQASQAHAAMNSSLHFTGEYFAGAYMVPASLSLRGLGDERVGELHAGIGEDALSWVELDGEEVALKCHIE